MKTFLLFDHDGVLVDTEPWYFLAGERALAEIGVTLDKEQYLLDMTGVAGTWAQARAAGVDDDTIDRLRQVRNGYYQEYLRTEPIEIDGVVEALEELSAYARMAIVTTSEREHFELIHRHRHITQHMEFVLVRDDYSRPKPDPEPYLTALRRFGASHARGPGRRGLVARAALRGRGRHRLRRRRLPVHEVARPLAGDPPDPVAGRAEGPRPRLDVTPDGPAPGSRTCGTGPQWDADRMLEALTGTGLATAAGLNAYIPLLVIGTLTRWTDVIDPPAGWEWLSNGWVLAVLAVLLVLEVVADKIPGVDTVNDVVQTVVRPVAGGIAFGAGSSSQTAVVTDPEAFVRSGQWLPVVVGIVMALGVHGAKATVRPVANAATLGAAAPVVSTVEDATSAGLSFAAILAPLLVLVGLVALVVVFLRFRARRRRGGSPGETSPQVAGPPPPVDVG